MDTKRVCMERSSAFSILIKLSNKSFRKLEKFFQQQKKKSQDDPMIWKKSLIQSAAQFY